jgi:single-stranded-DNA-specific exonuclease
MPDPTRPDLLIYERPRAATLGSLGSAVHPLLARIYAARGVNEARELDLSLSALHPPEALTGGEAAAKILADAIVEGPTSRSLATSTPTAPRRRPSPSGRCVRSGRPA